jgi:putative hydrolase of the HAD superfamily
MQPTKNIIFDLGGVLMDIDFSLTHRAFEQLGVHNFAELYNQYHADTFFSDFEKGKIEKETFFDHIRRICHCNLSNEEIRDAWNALLIGFPEERIRWLLRVKEKYRIFLFSNTNIIHYESFSASFKEAFGLELNSCFSKAYYSHEMGLRKPDAAGYLAILDEQQLDPAETIFIDDTLKNTEAAKELGLQTIHLQPPVTVTNLSL